MLMKVSWVSFRGKPNDPNDLNPFFLLTRVCRLCQSLFDRVRKEASATAAVLLGTPAAGKEAEASNSPVGVDENLDPTTGLSTPPPMPTHQDSRLIRAGVVVSFYEIYNEQVRDLFAPSGSSIGKSSHNLKVREVR